MDMASVENRSQHLVTVKHRDDLNKTFPHTAEAKAEGYCQSLSVKGSSASLAA
jgi:hypothetical protein